jgi:hypothetical protein
VIPLLSHQTRYSWTYGHLIFSAKEMVVLKCVMLNHYFCYFSSCFFVNSCSTFYLLYNFTFIVWWDYVLFELWPFEFFWRRGACDARRYVIPNHYYHYFSSCIFY